MFSDEPKFRPISSNWKVLAPSAPASIVRPPPFATALLVAPSAKVMFLSATANSTELTVVVVPLTIRSPMTYSSPVLSPIPAGSIVIEEGPVMDVPVTMIESPSLPVLNEAASMLPETATF